ncbi:unnamed protein product [Laminaria digitata]
MNRRFLHERDAFPKSVDEYNQQVQRRLQHRRAELDAAWTELEDGWKAHNERMVTLGVRPRTNDENLVQLNVGGSNVTLCWNLLAEAEGFKDSVLGALLEGVWGEGRIPRDADGRIVLDESPMSMRHIIHNMLTGRGASSVAVGLPDSAASSSSAVAIDEAPCLIFTAHVMGLPGYVPAHPRYVNMNGSSTTLEPFEIAPFCGLIRRWVGDTKDEMTLVYRATRDGFGRKAFITSCNKDSSPRTVSLFRISPDQGSEDDDSVVGLYSRLPWSTIAGTQLLIDEGAAFVFMLKDGRATPERLGKPTRWRPTFAYMDKSFVVPRSDGPYVGGDDLVTTFDRTSGSCTLQTKHHEGHFETGSSALFSALNGKNVVEIEVYRYSTPSRTTTPAPSTTKPDGDALTDARACDVRSFGETIASSLMEERVVLDRAVKEMEAAGARVSAAVGALETVYGSTVAAGERDAVVTLNVRGTKMTTMRSTLQACPRSALAAMFNADRWPATGKDKDEHGRRLIDCDPTCFSKILDVLRMRKRSSWSGGAPSEKQEGGSGKCWGAIIIKKGDIKAFRTAVHMYFPGCESFILGLCRLLTTSAA